MVKYVLFVENKLTYFCNGSCPFLEFRDALVNKITIALLGAIFHLFVIFTNVVSKQVKRNSR